jgi:hypothetical protein
MIGSTMENLVRWTIVGLELAALAAITRSFVWSVAKSIVVYVHGMADESYASFRRDLGRSIAPLARVLHRRNGLEGSSVG